MGLDDLVALAPVGLDASLFIYWIEEHPEFLAPVTPVITAVIEERLPAVASALTLMEVLVVPYRAGNEALAARYEHLLLHSRGLRIVGLDLDVLRLAARLRGQVRLRTPDAIQCAAALHAGCRVFVTNDRDLPPVPGLKVVQLRELQP